MGDWVPALLMNSEVLHVHFTEVGFQAACEELGSVAFAVRCPGIDHPLAAEFVALSELIKLKSCRAS
jgi:hypothetical protein